MAKYQIILESDSYLADDEFADLFKDLDIWDQFKDRPKFEILEARNLEGIKKELWEKKDSLKNNNGTETKEEWNQVVEESFEEIKDLFKLD